jgi:hypothetical protein
MQLHDGKQVAKTYEGLSEQHQQEHEEELLLLV